MRVTEVHESSQVAVARRTAVALAQAHGFSEGDCGRVAIVTTELATNLVKHGGGGTLLTGAFEDATGAGIECLALDRGRGIPDVEAAVQDGFSTTTSPGTGLGAVIRGSHATDIYSGPGIGTAILARLEPGSPTRAEARGHPPCGVVSVAMPGEEACGDSWHRKETPDGFTLMVADGLGHGVDAASASLAAVRALVAARQLLPSELLAVMHGALRPTRGAAVGIAQADHAAGPIVFAGVGNVAATLVGPTGTLRRMVSHNGTIGHIAKHMRDFTYPRDDAALVVLASDGLGTAWQIAAYPGLVWRHPTLVAAVLYRDHRRGRDDVTVAVCRLG